MPRRVVVTGTGVVSPLGQSAGEHFDGLVSARIGIGPITLFKVGDFPVKYAGEVKNFQGAKFVRNRKAVKMMARDILLSVTAAHLAAKDAGIFDGVEDPTRLGVSMGAGLIPQDLGELGAAVAHSLDENGRFDLRKFGREGLANLVPLWLLKYLPNMLNSHISIEYNAQGPNNCITAGNASGLVAVGEAARVIERGDADLMLAGGAQTKVDPLSFVRLYLAGKLSTSADVAVCGSRPFDRARSGMVAGEGSAVVVLEEESRARARGVKILAEVAGFGSSCGGQLLPELSADGRGAVEAMRSALADAKLAASDIDAVFSDASGLAEDAVEAKAIAEVLGPGKPVTATRGAAGHMAAAAGAADVAAAATAVSRRVLPPIAGSEDADGLPIDLVRRPREGELGAVLVNAFTFGGQTASVILKRYTP